MFLSSLATALGLAIGIPTGLALGVGALGVCGLRRHRARRDVV